MSSIVNSKVKIPWSIVTPPLGQLLGNSTSSSATTSNFTAAVSNTTTGICNLLISNNAALPGQPWYGNIWFLKSVNQ